jgi:hypothetical protein
MRRRDVLAGLAAAVYAMGSARFLNAQAPAKLLRIGVVSIRVALRAQAIAL